MKKLFSLLCILYTAHSFGQNVGIGETSPTAMKLQVKAADSAVLLVHNSTSAGTNIKTSLFFKTGTAYSGGIATIGSSQTHRMGLFTYGGTVPSSLLERLTILDGGKVGIGNIAPESKFHVLNTDSAIATFHNSTTLNAECNVAEHQNSRRKGKAKECKVQSHQTPDVSTPYAGCFRHE